MLELLIDKWWLFVLRGITAIVFGILAFVRPDLALATLVTLYGVFALTDGVLSIGASIALSRTRFMRWLLLEGLIGIAAGAVALALPGATAVVLLTFFGVWLVISGILRIVFAIEMRKVIDNEWLLAMAGFCSLGAGVLTLLSPLQSAMAWMWIMGVYAFAVGTAILMLGGLLKKLGGPGSKHVPAA